MMGGREDETLGEPGGFCGAALEVEGRGAGCMVIARPSLGTHC